MDQEKRRLRLEALQKKADRFTAEKEAIFQIMAIGEIRTLPALVEETYQLLGAAFFGGIAIDKHSLDPNLVDSKTPEAEIIFTVHWLLENKQYDPNKELHLLSDRRLTATAKS